MMTVVPVFVGLKLTDCNAGESYYRLNYLDSGRVRGIVRGTDEAAMTIASYGNQVAVMNHQDDPLVSLPYSSNKNTFSALFLPKY